MSKSGIIVAEFGAIGKTTLGNKYDNIIDLDSGDYHWDNTGFKNVPFEQLKGKKERPENEKWPSNYHKAAIERYDIVLTPMYWHLLDYLENNNIEYYLAYPTLDSEKILEKRCYDRGNNSTFIDELKINLKSWYYRLNKYHPKELLVIKKDKYLEDVLKRKGLLK